MNTIVIVIEDGMIQQVFSNEEAEVKLFDFDLLDSKEEERLNSELTEIVESMEQNY